MSVIDLTAGTTTPCRSHDPELWFAERPEDLARAQSLCGGCVLRVECLAGALERREPWGVWGGELFDRGAIVARKRPRGRPRKDDHRAAQAAAQQLHDRLADLAGELADDLLVDAGSAPGRSDGAAA